MGLPGTCWDIEERKGVDQVDRDGTIHPRLRALEIHCHGSSERERAEKQRKGMDCSMVRSCGTIHPSVPTSELRLSASCCRSWEQRKGMDRSIAMAR